MNASNRKIIRLDASNVEQILKKAKQGGCPIPLWNSLNGTLYRLDCTEIKFLSKACEKPVSSQNVRDYGIPQQNVSNHYVLEISIHDEKVYLIFHSYVDPIYIVVMAHLYGRNLYGKVRFVGFGNVVYSPEHKIGQILINAVKRRRKPSIASLLNC
jgi:hypothetical protein